MKRRSYGCCANANEGVDDQVALACQCKDLSHLLLAVMQGSFGPLSLGNVADVGLYLLTLGVADRAEQDLGGKLRAVHATTPPCLRGE